MYRKGRGWSPADVMALGGRYRKDVPHGGELRSWGGEPMAPNYREFLPAYGRSGMASIGTLACDNALCAPGASGWDEARIAGSGLRRPPFSAWCDALLVVAIGDSCLFQATSLGRSLVGLRVFVWASLELAGLQLIVW